MILLTGASGFVGSAVVREWIRRFEGEGPEAPLAGRGSGTGAQEKGSEVERHGNISATPSRKQPLLALVNRNRGSWEGEPGVEVLESSLVDLPEHKERLAGLHTIIHLASKHIDRDGTGFEQTNVEGTRKLMELAAELGVRRVIYLSSTGVYGHRAFRDADESTPPQPDTDLSRSKYQAEQIIRSFAPQETQVFETKEPQRFAGNGTRGDTEMGGRGFRGNSIQSLVLRPRFIIGPGDQNVLPRFVKAAHKLPFWLKRGKARLSMIDVRDLAGIILRFALLEDVPFVQAGPVVHVANGEAVTIRSLVEGISDAYGIEKKRINLPYWPLYALVRGKERLLRRDPESPEAGSLSSIRLKFISRDQHFSHAKLMSTFPDLSFIPLAESIRDFKAQLSGGFQDP